MAVKNSTRSRVVISKFGMSDFHFLVDLVAQLHAKVQSALGWILYLLSIKLFDICQSKKLPPNAIS